MEAVVQTTRFLANEYWRERQYEEAERALRQALAEDEQARMRVKDLPAYERDRE